MNKTALGLFVLCCSSLFFLCAFANTFEERALQARFSGWMKDNKRSYDSEEFLKRWNQWRVNAQFVEQHNSDPNQTYEVEMNEYADMSIEEFTRVYLGLIRAPEVDDEAEFINGTNPFPEDHEGQKRQSVPATFDWRTQGAVTPVKNQGSCGDCYNFAATGSIEGAWKIAKGQLVSLSEQHLCKFIFPIIEMLREC